ncbi:hypothetical protein ACFL0H_09165 [Thermodesulfobacteriota bacterium]
MATGDEMKGPERNKGGCQLFKVPTDDELKALNALKAIKERVREIKKRFSEMSSTLKDGDTQVVGELEREMARLKMEWKEWEKRKEDAIRERMILLGHEEP